MRDTAPRRAWVWIEALSLLPASTLVPFMLVGSFGLVVSFLETMSDTTRSLHDRLLDASLAAHFIVWVVAAAMGMIGLWSAVLDATSSRVPSVRYRAAQCIGIFSGFAAVAELVRVSLVAESYGHRSHSDGVFWSVLLAGPVIAGIRHLFRLFRPAG